MFKKNDRSEAEFRCSITELMLTRNRASLAEFKKFPFPVSLIELIKLEATIMIGLQITKSLQLMSRFAKDASRLGKPRHS